MRKLSFRQSKKYTQSYPTGSWGSGIKHGFSIQSLEPPETQEVASAASLYTSEASPREAGQGRPTWGQGLWSQASHVHGRHGGQPSAFQNPSRVALAWVRFWTGGRAEEGRAAGTPPPCHRPRHGQVPLRARGTEQGMKEAVRGASLWAWAQAL